MRWMAWQELMQRALQWVLPSFLWWQKQKEPEPTITPPPPSAADVYAAGLVPPPQQQAEQQEEFANRAQRRALERARRRRDKFVTPKGPKPAPQLRAKAQPRLPKLPPEPDNAALLIADKHEYGGSDDVLYEERELYGEFQFRDTILDQLDRYFVYLERMRVHDKGAYGFYKELGITIVPYISVGVYREDDFEWPLKKLTEEEIEAYRKQIYLPPAFKRNRPMFGCFAYGIDPLSEQRELEHSEIATKIAKKKQTLCVPKFMYFKKYSKPPPEVQPMSGGDVYSMTVWWDRPHDPKYDRKGGTPSEFAVFISADGAEIKVLRTLTVKPRWIHSRKKTKGVNERGWFSIPEKAWRIPEYYEHWAADYGLSAEDHLAHIFCDAAKRIEWSNFSMVRVAASKGDMTAVFGVNVRRLSYFFQDRDIELTERGVKKRVFHMVRPHERITQQGKHAVRMHFRGSKEFEWAGYHIAITIPGRDHFMLPELSTGAEDEYWWEGDKRDMLTEDQLGKYLAEKIKKGVGARR